MCPPEKPADRTAARALTLLTPEEVQELGGLPGDAVAGIFEGDDVSPAAFRPNPRFGSFLHQVIATHGPRDPELREAARSQGEGWVYVIDLRTPEGPHGRVPPEDIVGAFQVEDGLIIEGSYTSMETHRIYTSNGLVVLPPGLRRALVDELSRRPR